MMKMPLAGKDDTTFVIRPGQKRAAGECAFLLSYKIKEKERTLIQIIFYIVFSLISVKQYFLVHLFILIWADRKLRIRQLIAGEIIWKCDSGSGRDHRCQGKLHRSP